MALDIFRFSFAVIFLGLHIALMIGFYLERKRDIKNRDASSKSLGSPLVSIIVPVHNEAFRMGPNLESIMAQDYPSMEIILVDDRSTDDTPAMLLSFLRQAKTTGKEARLIRIDTNPGPNFKQFALGRGIAEARGEFLLFTDGDCKFAPSWARAMASRLSNPKVGALLGPVFKPIERSTFFYFYQAFDHAVRYMYLVGSTGLGSAGGGFGNNLIVRRETLAAIGGYDAVPFSVTEDAALIARIRSLTSYSVRAACATDVQVFTMGESDWKSFLRQTLRWNNGGLFSPDLSTRLNFTFLMITISMGIIALPLLPFFPSLWPLPVSVYCSMIMNTIAIRILAGPALPSFGLRYVAQILFTPIYFTFLTILGFMGFKVTWKGETI